MDELLKHYQVPDEALDVVPYTPIPPEERRRRVKELNDNVRENVARLQNSSEFKNFLISMSRFHKYSWNNQMLIWLQKPDATRVAGYNTWRDLGRYVKKGERGIQILAPLGPTAAISWVRATDNAVYSIQRTGKDWDIYDDNDKLVAGGFPSYAAAARRLKDMGFVEHRQTLTVNNFKIVHVFDLSQTEGKPLPEVEIPELTTATNPELWDGLLALCKADGITVSFDPDISKTTTADGYLRRPNFIWIKPQNTPAKQLNALLHEYSHYNTAEVWHIPKQDAETIAECSACVVGSFYGFDTGVISFPYVAVWAKEEKRLFDNMKTIQEVAEKIIDKVEALQSKLIPMTNGRYDARKTVRRKCPNCGAVVEFKSYDIIKPCPKCGTPVNRDLIPQTELAHPRILEQSYSLEQLRRMAIERGVSSAGTKRDIINRLNE
jgi:hypothetical protein